MLLFDGHGDIWTDITVERADKGKKNVFRERHYPKFLKGGVTGGVFVIWIDPPYDETDTKGRSLQIVKCINEELEESKDIMLNVRSYEDFAKAEESGRLAIVTGMEGASQIGDDLDLLNFYHDEVGVRDIMLTWNEMNPLATSWTQDPERGLTEVGKKAVRRMYDLGINIDVSHLNDKSFWDVMRAAQGPVIASHSNARALCPLTRNLSDEMIKEIAKTGGLIGMNSIRQLVSEDKSKQTLDGVLDHFEHMVNIAGIEHIGLGFDFDDYLDGDTLEAFIFDGIESPSVTDLANESEACNFLKGMKARGYSDSDIELVAYKNFYRVFKEVWK